MTAGADSRRWITARPVDHAARIESSRARLSESRKLCRSTAVIICETRVTIGRTPEMLRIGPPPDARDDRPKTARNGLPDASLTSAGRLRQRARDEDESPVDIG